MQKLLAIAVLLVTILLPTKKQAQSTDSTKYIFKQLPDALFPSGLHHDQSSLKYLLETTAGNIHSYNGSIPATPAPATFHEELYQDIYYSQRLNSSGLLPGNKRAVLMPLDQFYASVDSTSQYVDVPLFLNWFELDEINEYALDSGYFDFVNDQFHLIPVREYIDPQHQYFIHNHSPLDSALKGMESFKTIYAGAKAPAQYIDGNNIRLSFQLPTSLFQTNISKPNTVDIDFDNGQGFRTVNLDQRVLVQYSSNSSSVESTVRNLRIRVRHGTHVYEAAFQINLIFNISQPDLVWTTENQPFPTCIKTSQPSEPAKVSIRFADANLGLQKPLILVEGFESSTQPYGNITYEGLASGYIYNKGERVYLGMEKLAWLYDSLHHAGFDIVHVDFKESKLSVEENAANVLKVLNWVEKQNPTNASVIVGASMGGLISRMALLQLEDAGCCMRIAGFGTFDTPHQGAFIPVGLQAAAKRMGEMLWMLPGKQSYKNAINSQAAREMLVEHLDQSASTDRYRLTQFFDNRLPNVRRFAIVNGSDLGSVEPLQDGQKRLVSWGKSKALTYKLHVGSSNDTLQFNRQGGRIGTFKLLGADVDAHQSNSNYLYFGNKRQSPIAFSRIKWIARTGATRAIRFKAFAMALGIQPSLIDQLVRKVQNDTNDKLAKRIKAATQNGYQVQKSTFNRKFAELPGGYTNTGKAFESFLTVVHSERHTFIPSYSALGLNRVHAFSSVRGKMNEIPFHTYHAPGLMQDGASSNTEHIYTDEDVIQFSMRTFRGIYESLPAPNGVLQGDFNIAKEHNSYSSYISNLGSVTIPSSTKLAVAGQFKASLNGHQYTPDTKQNIEVFVGEACSQATVTVSGVLTVGSGINSKGVLRVKKGATVHIKSGGKLFIDHGSTLVLEEGARLIIDQGGEFDWDNGALVSSGEIILNQGVDFSPAGSGRLTLQQGHVFDQPQGGRISLKDSDVDLFTEVIIPSSTDEFSLETCKVVLHDGAQLISSVPLRANRSSFSQNGIKQWRGVLCKDSALFQECEFSRGMPAIQGNMTAVIGVVQSKFTNAEIGVQLQTDPSRFERNEFDYCTVGVKFQVSNTHLDRCAFRNCQVGIMVVGTKGQADINRSIFHMNTVAGVQAQGLTIRLSCSEFLSNTTGVLLDGSSFNISGNAGNNFEFNSTAINGTMLEGLNMHNGHNTFVNSTINDIHATFSSTAGIPWNGSYYYLSANYNAFSMGGQSTQMYIGRDRVYTMKTASGSPNPFLCPIKGPAKTEMVSESVSEDQIFEVFPNPSVENWAEVQFSPVQTPGVLSVFDLNGSIVYSTQLKAGDYRKRVDVPYVSGTYVVRLITESRAETKRWIVTL